MNFNLNATHKKLSFLFILSTLISVTYAQSYKSALQKVNTFLKSFDNGYYGHLEIKDGVFIVEREMNNLKKHTILL